MSDFAIARQNMVDCQVRPSDVTDNQIIDAMLAIPREIFVPEDRRALAYLDLDLIVSAPNAPKRVLIKPAVIAKLLQAAEIGETDSVLVVGTASGYTAAIAAKLAQRSSPLIQMPRWWQAPTRHSRSSASRPRRRSWPSQPTAMPGTVRTMSSSLKARRLSFLKRSTVSSRRAADWRGSSRMAGCRERRSLRVRETILAAGSCSMPLRRFFPALNELQNLPSNHRCLAFRHVTNCG